MVFSNLDPHPRQVQLEGTNIVLATTLTRVSPVQGPPAPMHTSAISGVVDGTTPGYGVPTAPNPISSHPQGQENPTASNMPPGPATVANNNGGIVTPVNVLNLLCLELREGARIGYSGPRHFRFSKNLPTASLNPEVVTSNLTEEVNKGRTMGPFPSPRLRISRSPPLALSPRNIQTNSEPYFICPSPNQGPQA